MELWQKLAVVEKDNDYLKNTVLKLLRHADKAHDDLKAMGDIVQLLVKRDAAVDKIRQSQEALDHQQTAINARLNIVETTLTRQQQQATRPCKNSND